jgi:uncharacterized membrane protein
MDGTDDASARPQRWSMKRRCALSPQEFGAGIAFACVVQGVLGLGFLLQGFLPIAAFCLLTAFGLVAAFLAQARHALDREQLVLDGDRLDIVQHVGPLTRHVRLPAQCTRVSHEQAPGGLVVLSAGAVSVRVGVHLPSHGRAALARELHRALRNGPAWAPTPSLDSAVPGALPHATAAGAAIGHPRQPDSMPPPVADGLALEGTAGTRRAGQQA